VVATAGVVVDFWTLCDGDTKFETTEDIIPGIPKILDAEKELRIANIWSSSKNCGGGDFESGDDTELGAFSYWYVNASGSWDEPSAVDSTFRRNTALDLLPLVSILELRRTTNAKKKRFKN
jgi:hypothetical protein